jgi:hypothetical protein
MLQHVGNQQTIESADASVSRTRKLLLREGLQAGGARHADAGNVGIHPYPLAIEVMQIAAHTASHVENVAWIERSEIPSIRPLDTQDALPKRRTAGGQIPGVIRRDRFPRS